MFLGEVGRQAAVRGDEQFRGAEKVKAASEAAFQENAATAAVRASELAAAQDQVRHPHPMRSGAAEFSRFELIEGPSACGTLGPHGECADNQAEDDEGGSGQESLESFRCFDRRSPWSVVAEALEYHLIERSQRPCFFPLSGLEWSTP